MPKKRKKSAPDSLKNAASIDILSNLPAIICELSIEGKTLFVNDPVKSFTGYEASELLGKNWWDIFCSSHNRREISQLYELVKMRDVSDYELDLKAKNGDLVAVNWSSKNVYSKDRKLEKVIGICLEITGRRYAEEALRQSLERYRLLFENQGEGFGTVDEGEFFTFCNPAAEKIFGVKEGSLIGRNLREFTSKKDFEIIKGQTEKRRMGEQSSYEIELQRADGTKKTILVTSTPRYNAVGDYAGAYGVFRDITERKNAEDRLVVERDLAKKYIDSAGVFLMVLDVDQKIILINKKGCDVLGLPEKDIIGRNWFENFVPEKLRERGKTLFREILDKKSGSLRRFEGPIISNGNREVLVEWSNNVLIDNMGNVIGTISSGEDVTDRKKMEEALSLSEKKYRQLYEKMMDGVATVDMEGKITKCNSAFQKMVGYGESELRELTYHDITPERWHSLENEILRDQVLKRGFSDAYKKEYRKKSGEIIPIEITTYLIRNGEDKPSGMWAIVRELPKNL